jgi:hypothetical protein
MPRSAACQRGEAANVDSDLVAASPHLFWTVSADGDGAAVGPGARERFAYLRRAGASRCHVGLTMLPSPQDDPDRWFECASQMRALASSMRDPSVKLLALRVAKDLDWFAECLALHKGRRETPASR